MRGSLSDFARHIGASPAYVTKLKSQGRLVLVEGDGGKMLVDFEQSARAIRNTTDMSKASNGKNAGGAGSQPAGEVAGQGRFDAVFRQAQAKERVFESKMAELEYRKMAGELIEVSAIRSELGSLLASLRESLMQIPSRLSPVVAAETDAVKVHDAIAHEIHQSLEQLTNTHAKMEAAAA